MSPLVLPLHLSSRIIVREQASKELVGKVRPVKSGGNHEVDKLLMHMVPDFSTFGCLPVHHLSPLHTLGSRNVAGGQAL